MGHGLPYIPRGIELAEHFRWPGYGWFVTQFDNIPIDYTSKSQSMTSIRKAVKRLKSGKSLLIMAEAHRTFTGSLEPFFAGAFAIAKMAGVPIVPVVALGAFRIKRRGHFLLRPGRITLKILDYLDSAKYSADELKDISFKMMDREIEEYHRENPPD